jgi:hypothetical protein
MYRTNRFRFLFRKSVFDHFWPFSSLLHSIKVQKDYFEDPARKIHMLRGSRYLRLRGLSLTLNQVPQALLSIWASQNSKDKEKLTDGRTLCPLPECCLNSHHHKHSDKGNTPSLSVNYINQYYVNIQLGGEHHLYLATYFLTYLFIYLFLLW